MRRAESPPGLSQKDDADGLTVGARADGTGTNATWMIELNAISARSHGLWAKPTLGRTLEPADVLTEMSHVSGGALLGRWTRQMASGRSLQVESSFDVARRNEPVGDYTVSIRPRPLSDTRAPIGARHDVIAGVGYRSINVVRRSRGVALVPAVATQQVFNSFVQNEIAVVPERLSLTLGAKVEHDATVGFRHSADEPPYVAGRAESARMDSDLPCARYPFAAGPQHPRSVPAGADVVRYRQCGSQRESCTHAPSPSSVSRRDTAHSGDFTVQRRGRLHASTYARLRTTEPQQPYVSMTPRVRRPWSR